MAESPDQSPVRHGVSIVVPTFREAENIPELVSRIAALDLERRGQFEVILVDDASADGIDGVVERLGQPWVRLHVRRGERGLSSAVVAGCRLSRFDTLVVMDADLSHPPEAVPALLAALDGGADMAVGSRYAPGGSVGEDWGLLRRLNSRAATLLARPLTAVRDPMSGFFALRRTTFDRAIDLNPIGYKIGLELLIKCGVRDVREIPIHFAQRAHGRSKLGLRQQVEFLRHVARLAWWRARSAAGGSERTAPAHPPRGSVTGSPDGSGG